MYILHINSAHSIELRCVLHRSLPPLRAPLLHVLCCPSLKPSVLLTPTRKLPLGTQRDRSANLCPQIHHHLPVLPPRRASPTGHPDSRVVQQAERFGRGGLRYCFPCSRCYGMPPTAHGSPVVYRGVAKIWVAINKVRAGELQSHYHSSASDPIPHSTPSNKLARQFEGNFYVDM